MSLNISYKLEYSEFLKVELNRLKDGGSAEKQRFQNIISTTARVQSNPLSHVFKKDLPDDYKAADVLQQYRLFFKITNIDDKNSVIFFTWVNDEDSLHVTGDIDDAYNVFKKLLSNGKIETYSHKELIVGKDYFNIHNKWGENYIYFDYECKFTEGKLHAHSNLVISKTSNNEYRLMPISVTEYNCGLATKLLQHICNEAKKNKYILYFELNTNLKHIDKNRHILTNCGFTLNILDWCSDEVEIWISE